MDPHPSRLQIEITQAARGWAAAIPKIEEFCRATVAAALEASAPADAELGLLLADDAAVRQLNRDWRGKDQPTNVLSFPNEAATPPGAPVLLGDVALAFETVAREAAEQGKSFSDHARHLLVHGVLHLLGHDHANEADAERMEALERRILARLGVADPYAAEHADG